MTALAAQGECSRVRFGQTLFEYQIRRTHRSKTVSIAVVPNEGIVVTAPARATRARLDEIVRQKGAWILQRLKRRSDLPPPLPEREWVSGETYSYLGRQYRLRIERGSKTGSVRLHGGILSLVLERGLTESARASHARRSLIQWYRQRGEEYLPRRFAPWASRLGLPVPRIVIAEPAKRWGSATRDGTIRINWRIMQAPVTLVDYVVLHELVHLIHRDHSPAFWATVGRVMPDYEARKRRLRELGPRLVW